MKAHGGGRARIMSLQPADLRRHVAGVEHDAGARPDQRGRHILDLLLGPAIHPDEAGCQRAALAVDGDAAVELPADTERADLPGRDAGLAERAGDGRPDRPFPESGILLRRARTQELDAIGCCRLAAYRQRAVGDRDL
jgi:hypothetical protein